ncbi:DUF499 domain-containing protein [Stygiolobus azoricus]|uniref:DUF499 domain-containing protein n=1 Tax=Stygiolobus azoricus TaxID=41675 RepID=A0A650CPX7_9CREN|nr:DUF499 domain-containing protein [Stygiolobus azoricus]QGR19702.1 DUF499 domain-containing protein [Stygiolobus azoricus]
MGFLNYVKVWSDVLEPRLDEKAAPSLGGVHLGKEEDIYSDPVEFFKRTLITKHMVEALENVADALMGRGGHKLVMLLSLFGGGKTHMLLTIYHAFRKPDALLNAKTEDNETRERLHRLAEELSKMGGVRVVVLDGYFSELAPTPVNPLKVPEGYRVQTIWGSLAHQLGRFDEVRENDEKLLAPPADVILKLLGNKPVLILVDELAHYVVGLKSTSDPGLQNYGDQVLSFVESLAKAIDLSRHPVVLIVSLPVEERGEGLEVEERYKSQLDVVKSLHKSVSRVESKRIVPVTSSDIASILKVRIFESIDHKAARAVSSSLAELYRAEENKEVFGDDVVRKAHLIENTYPFHPSYINTLVDIVDKHEGLQKTRDAIRITRKVIRKLVNAKSAAELVMPFHIDIEDREIRGILFSDVLYRQYDTILEDDVVERTKSYEKPELAKTIAKTILVKTFVYTGSIKQQLQLYPDKHEIIVSTFEPSMARALNLQPKDYLDALEWASNNLVYLLSESERYWFTQIVSPIGMVEMTAKTIDDHEALKKVEEYGWRLLTTSYKDVVSGSRKHKQGGEAAETPFNTGSSMVLVEPKPVDHDSRDYILVAVLSPIQSSDIEKVIYETTNGELRRYANTVYIIYPRDSNSVLQMIRDAKHLIACDIVSEELDSMYKDEDDREVMKKKLKRYCEGMEGVEGKLVRSILAGLNLVAYPSFDEKSHRNTYKFTNATMADTIIETATHALKSDNPPKLYDELDFSVLEYMLSQIGIELSEGNFAKTVSDIVDYFYSNPRLPMVREETIKQALIDGVKSLKIGVKRQDKIFFKKVYECRSRQDCNPPSIVEGEAPHSLEPSDLILPWRTALQEQLEGLGHVKEERVGGGIRRIWYAFYIDGSLVPVAEASKRPDLEVLHNSPLVRITEFIEEGVDVKLDNYEITALPGEEVTVTVLIERIGGFKGDLSLVATFGTLSSNALSISDESPSAKIDWRIKAPEEPGTYSYEVRVMNASGNVLKTSSLKIIVKPKGREAVKGVPPKDTKLSVIEVKVPVFNFKPLRIIDTKFSSNCEVEEAVLELEAEISGKKPRASLRLSSVSIDDVINIFPAIAQRYGIAVKSASYWIRLRPRNGDYIIAPEFTQEEAREIGDYMTYNVFEGG